MGSEEIDAIIEALQSAPADETDLQVRAVRCRPFGSGRARPTRQRAADQPRRVAESSAGGAAEKSDASEASGAAHQRQFRWRSSEHCRS
jgi:hypothetical protein